MIIILAHYQYYLQLYRLTTISDYKYVIITRTNKELNFFVILETVNGIL